MSLPQPGRAAPDVRVEVLRAAVAAKLPAWNIACRDGSLATSDWLDRVRGLATDTASVAETTDVFSKTILLKCLGFIACSAEFHSQRSGAKVGAALVELPEVRRGLVAAADGRRLPYLTAYDLWIDNAAAELSFTGEEHHRFFRHSVRAQFDLHSVANDVARAVVDGDYAFGTTPCLVMMEFLRAAVAGAARQFQVMKHDLTPVDFNEFRNWLPATVIDDEPIAGPNAAWLDSMISTDLLFGVATDSHFASYVAPALKYMPPTARTTVLADLGRRTLADVAWSALQLPAAPQPVDVVTTAILTADATTRSTVATFVAAWKDLVGASAAHFGEIERCLIRPTFSADELDRMAVKPDQGTGGHGHQATKAVHAMRKTDAVMHLLYLAIREVAA